ncbi:voltage-gated potassium channel [Coprinellus micaceus]|uniref:Voltage-gated potassium channel n=1 Tax=Coprinellus micaceus TaxID=71717 RepID=A0A4Y7T7G4_COPMI|nr:voltage-gated potassium channel [Coprinellus micaceus]
MAYRAPPDGTRYELLGRIAGVAHHQTKPPILERSALEISHLELNDDSSRYRILPLFAGVVVPFSILLAIPSVTGRWYVRTGEGNVVVASTANPRLLEIAMILSLVCGVLANGCLVVRFAERRVKLMTLLIIFLLTIHDVVNIATLAVFGIQRRVDDGFTYGQPFWMTVFTSKGSGLTRKQRTLVVISIVLLTYIAFGALIQSFILKLSFIDALYFTVATIETVGFGDIIPTSTGSRVFTMFYITFGILHIAVAVSYAREALLEGIVLSLQHRILGVRRRERDRRVRARWRDAVQWRLRAQGSPTWVDRPGTELVTSAPRWSWSEVARRIRLSVGWEADHDHNCEGSHRRGRRRRLHLEALTEAQLHAAALEAGTSLHKLLPPDYIPASPLRDTGHYADPSTSVGYQRLQPPLTYTRVGGMARLVTAFAHTVGYGEHAPRHGDWSLENADDLPTPLPLDDAALRKMLTKEEDMAFRVRLGAAVSIFLTFWLVGSVLFTVAEKWPFGMAVYFCFVTFTTVGYGDLSPRTPAGRSIFVAWALLGIAAMTILLAILTEAYSTRYKQVVQTEESLLVEEAKISDSDSAPASLSEPPREVDQDTLIRQRIRDIRRFAEESLEEGDVDKMRRALEDISQQLSDLETLSKA